MNRFALSAFFAAAAVAGNFHDARAQTINSTAQTGSPRVVASRSAPATAARPVATARVAPQIGPRPMGLNIQRFDVNLPRTIAQPPAYANPGFAALNAQRTGPVQPITLDPATRGTELRTLETMREQRLFGTNNQTLATINPQRHVTNRAPGAEPQREKPDAPKDAHGKMWHNKKNPVSFDEAFRRHWHEWHDRNWWHNHCDTIVFVTSGYYFLDGSYWYPAYGYDPLNNYYDYDGPVYTYSNLLPDEVIANVQTALQQAGYYYGEITGSLGVDTRAAIANFQRDYGLQITGAIDEATVEALGLYQTDDANNFQTDQGY